MANFLFWNLNKKPLKEEIIQLCHYHEVDILILAESDLPESDLLDELNRDLTSEFNLPFNLSPKLSFFIRFPLDCFEPVLDEGGIAIRMLSPPIGLDILIIAVHLPSKLHYKEVDQVFECTRLIKTIEEAEHKVGHRRTVVVGDFNMNPFEVGFISSDGLHAVMDKRIAKKISRKVQGEKRNFFYNPMWGRLGDTSFGPPGTFFYNDSSHVCYFWNTFDQVILRPQILPYFKESSLEILSSVAGRSLLKETGTPDRSVGSDHLPILFKIEIEREV